MTAEISEKVEFPQILCISEKKW